MFDLDITADQLVSALLRLAESETVCVLDSCGVGHLGSHLLIAGIEPVETLEISNDDPAATLRILDERLSADTAAIFTLSYDFGRKLLGIGSFDDGLKFSEPDAFVASFDVLIIHDYNTGRTELTGNADKFQSIREKLRSQIPNLKSEISNSEFSDLKSDISNFKSQISNSPTIVTSNFTKPEYLAAIESIKEQIRSGDTYQTNLTQQLTAQLPKDLTPEIIFERLRKDHPAPFSAYLKRMDSTVVSASPERFFKVSEGRNTTGRECVPPLVITTSPIKGTRPRGRGTREDELLRHDLLTSQKDLAENTMIVDLLRNDLGRICEYGSVEVEKLCDLEEHPTLFHLVSTISGEVKENTKPSDILKALFPCGSITGAPKISTMKIIDEIEPSKRGLSMGAIGYYLPSTFDSSDSRLPSPVSRLDLSVAIRTMVIRGQTATFNVGGGIVIDSDPEAEHGETLTKAKALLNAIGASQDHLR